MVVFTKYNIYDERGNYCGYSFNKEQAEEWCREHNGTMVAVKCFEY